MVSDLVSQHETNRVKIQNTAYETRKKTIEWLNYHFQNQLRTEI